MTVCYFTWDGEVMRPLRQSMRLADKLYVIGETYPLEIHEQRSGVSHRHYFATINEAWKNLPDEIAMDFPDAEKLRKRALIMAGFYDERRLVTSSPAEARKIAAFLAPADDYAVISVAGNVVVERKAKSQSVRAMGRRTFQESKTKVLDVLADMIGVSVEELSAPNEASAGADAGPRGVSATPRHRPQPIKETA